MQQMKKILYGKLFSCRAVALYLFPQILHYLTFYVRRILFLGADIMMTYDEISAERYEPQQFVNTHGQLMEAMQKQYKLPGVFKLTQCICRKDIQLFLMTTSREKWERVKIEYLQTISVEKYVQFIMEITCSHMREKLEEYYKAKIDFWYMFCPNACPSTINDEVCAYSVKIFDRPIFKAVGIHNGNLEDKLTRMASSHIRYLSGRGPERITTAILGNQYMVICVFGIIPLYINNYVSNSCDEGLSVRELLASLLSEVIDHVFHSEYNYIPDKRIKVDFEKNLLIAVVIARQCDNDVIS